jgi:hypothetical protein
MQQVHVITPYAAHCCKQRYPDAMYDSPNSLSRVREESILRATIAATPRNKDIFATSAPPPLPPRQVT